VGKPKYWEAEGGKSDKCMHGRFSIIGGTCPVCPQSLHRWSPAFVSLTSLPH